MQGSLSKLQRAGTRILSSGLQEEPALPLAQQDPFRTHNLQSRETVPVPCSTLLIYWNLPQQQWEGHLAQLHEHNSL